MPGTQFSLSESPGSRSRSGLVDFEIIDLESLDGLAGALFRSVSRRPREETVRESFRLFSPMDWEMGVRAVSAWMECMPCRADMLRDRVR